MKNAATMTRDGTAALAEALRTLTKKMVYIGIPESNDARKGEEFGNAAIGYVQENGSPARNIPARPHLVPGVQQAAPRVAGIFGAAARDVIDGHVNAVDNALDAAGLVAVSSVKNVIVSKIPPPLAESTVYGRQHRTHNRRDATDTTPLIDTGEYMAHITSVIREVK